MNIVCDLPLSYEKTIDGHVTTSTSGVSTVIVQVPLVRQSVDTGRFQPGVYRVNPYEVSKGSIGDSFRDSISRSYSSIDRYKRVVKHTGTVGGEYFAPMYTNQDYLSRPLPSTAAYEQLALQKAKSKVAAADLDLGESIGEYRETIQMLRNPLSELRKFLISDRARNLRLLKALAKRDKRAVNLLLGRTGKASARTMSSTWLELRYGLRPLVMLVQDVIEMVKSKQQEVWDPELIRSAKSSLTFTEETRVQQDYLVGSLAFRGTALVEDEIKVSASIQYRQSDKQSLLDQLGLTPRFLPETAWALTRLSFVVDWIFSIGPWIGSLRVAPSVTILGNTVGAKITRTVKPLNYAARYNYKLALWRDIDTSDDTKLLIEQYIRKCHVDISYLPHFTWGRTLDLYKAIDSLSLIWQLVANKRRG